MDADDISRPERLALQLQHMMSAPDLWVLGTAVEEIDEHGRVTDPISAEPDPYKNSRDLLECSPVWHPSVMMRRRPILAIGGYRSLFRRAADYDLWLRVDAHGGQIGNLTTIGLQYRVHAASATIGDAARQNRYAQLAKLMYLARPSIMRRRGLSAMARAIGSYWA